MKSNKNFYDLIIIGCGPAGITSAVYALRAGLSVLIIEKEAPGGKVTKTYEIENYPPFKNIKGVDLSVQLFDHATSFGAQFIGESVIKIMNTGKIKKVITNQNKYCSTALIIATGTKERELGVPGEKKYFSKGVSTCAVCDGALFKNKPVAVVGGGWSATEESLYLTRFASKLFLIHRRKVFRTPDTIIDKIKKNDKITMLLDCIVEEIIGDGTNVNAVKIKNILTNKKETIKVDGIFPYIGQIPNTQFIPKDWDILDNEGFIIIKNDKFETKIPGIFAAGDVLIKTLRQVANAVGDGANAGQSAVAYIDKINDK